MIPRLQLSFVLLLMLVALSSAAQTKAGISGTVRDKFEHAPIGKTFVLVHVNGGTDLHVRTDSQGSYVFLLSPGVYDVFFSAPGFSPICRKVEVQPDRMAILDAVLEASSVGMQEN